MYIIYIMEKPKSKYTTIISSPRLKIKDDIYKKCCNVNEEFANDIYEKIEELETIYIKQFQLSLKDSIKDLSKLQNIINGM